MWYNGLMTWLLRSPLHGLLDKSFMLVTYTGRQSGRRYSTPVNYSQEGNVLTVVSLRSRHWWRNVRGGRPLTLYVRGRDAKATGTVIEDEQGVSANLLTYLRKTPQLAKYFDVTLDPDGLPNREDVARAARNRVIVQAQLV